MISRTARAVPRPERHPGLVSRGHSSRRVTAQSTGTSPDIRTGGDTLRAPKHPGAVSIASPRDDVRKRLIRLQLQQHGFGNAQCLPYGCLGGRCALGMGTAVLPERPSTPKAVCQRCYKLRSIFNLPHVRLQEKPAAKRPWRILGQPARPRGDRRREPEVGAPAAAEDLGFGLAWLVPTRDASKEKIEVVCGPHGLARRRLRSSESRPAVGLWTGKS